MTPTPRNIWVQWKGERSGPYTETEVAAKIKTGEIGGLYSVECNGTEMSAGDFLQALQARSSVKPMLKAVVTVKPKGDKTVPIQASEVELAPVVPKAPPQPPSLPKMPTPVAPPPDRTSITVARNGQTFGPFTKELLTKYIGEGMFCPDDLAWHDGLPNWVRLGDIRLPGQSPTLPPLPSTYPASSAMQFPVLPAMPGPQAVQHTQSIATSSPQPTSAIYAGYLLCVIALFLFPPILGLAAFVLGIIVIAQGNAGHGVAIILLSVICALAGMFFGAAIMAGSQ
jgi:hypothetical protein